jgi:hypothetical protein
MTNCRGFERKPSWPYTGTTSVFASETGENCNKTQTRRPGSRPRFEPRHMPNESEIATATLVCSVFSVIQLFS